MFQTNVTGLINMTQAVLPVFMKRPDGGAGDIINIGDKNDTAQLTDAAIAAANMCQGRLRPPPTIGLKSGIVSRVHLV